MVGSRRLSSSSPSKLGVFAVVLLLIPACNSSKENDARIVSLRTNLLAAATALEAKQYARPVPRGEPPLPGSFGDAFTAHEAERTAIQAVHDASSRCLKTFAKTKDEPTKQKCRDDLAPSHAALESILDLARSEKPGAPKEALALTPMSTNKPIHRSLLSTCSRSAIEIEIERDAGQASAAVLTCVRTLEIARDYSMGSNLTGAMTVAACVEMLNEPCGRAIDALTPADKPGVHSALDAVATTLPPPADFFDAELVTVPLPLCGHYLDAGERAKLGPLGKAAVTSSDAQFAAIPEKDREKHQRLCLSGFESMQSATKAYRTPRGSAERTKLKSERKAETEKDKSLDLVDFDKYEVKLLEMQDRVHALSKR